jgi:hypothetical protein
MAARSIFPNQASVVFSRLATVFFQNAGSISEGANDEPDLPKLIKKLPWFPGKIVQRPSVAQTRAMTTCSF